jgi:hypothetical protein
VLGEVSVVLLGNGTWAGITKPDHAEDQVVVRRKLAPKEVASGLAQQFRAGGMAAARQTVERGAQV